MRDGEKRQLARHLRRNATDAERRLWAAIRRSALAGHRFRRQHPIGPYVADVVCLEKAVVVEIDGGQHAEFGHDAARDAWLAAQGYRVVRFWNNDVLCRTQDVLEEWVRVLKSRAPIPTFPRRRGRGLSGGGSDRGARDAKER